MNNIVENYSSWLNVFRGLMVVTLLPVGVIYLILSFFNQSIRTYCPCSFFSGTNMHIGLLTKRTSKQLDVVKSWNQVKVMSYAILWGFGYMMFQVIAVQFLALVLGWVQVRFAEFNLAFITISMVVVGLLMFLLPPIPGVPIYMALGITIPPKGRELFGSVGWSFIYCVAVSLALKLLACAMQQKLIGEQLSNSVKIRKMVAINTPMVRAIRVVLSDKGYTLAKVAVLVGGPDWPTSVMAGVMKLDLLPNLIGTLPIVVLIIPTVLTGTLYFLQTEVNEDGELQFPWASTLYVIMFAITGAGQLVSTVVAGIELEKAMTSRKEEIDRFPIDEEVKALEDSEIYYNKNYAHVTKWKRVPPLQKLILRSAVVLMVLSCYIVTLGKPYSFAKFEMTDTIEEALDGNWRNFILPLGWWALSFLFASLLLFTGFRVWADRATKQRIKENDVEAATTQ